MTIARRRTHPQPNAMQSSSWLLDTARHRSSSCRNSARGLLSSLVLLTALLGVAPQAAQAATTLSAGQSLSNGQQLTSSDGKYRAVMQSDGNFVVYGPTGAMWWTGTQASGSYLAMQTDGNLVIYAGGRAIWNAQTSGANASLAMQPDGNLVVYSGGRPLWSWMGGGTGATGDTLPAGQSMSNGQVLWSNGGRYAAIMQSDGNLVVYDNGNRAIWWSGTQASGSSLAMQSDGNLVIYAGGRAIWNTQTQGSGGLLGMQTDGNLVVYSAGVALWSWQGGRVGGGTADKGQAMVSAAASQSGRPYCFAGGNTSGPTHGTGGTGCPGATVGFDCSGLALYAVYQATGIALPHGHGMESRQGGTSIAKGQLQPGDLVFFGGGSLSNFQHVGVYSGNGMMWDAMDFGVPVQQHSLAYVEHGLPFVGAVRYR
jgi:cell wall-associated NlpC family hydrolase